MIINSDVINLRGYQELVASFVSTDITKERILTSEPFDSSEVIARALKINEEAYDLLCKVGDLRFTDLSDLTSSLNKAKKSLVLSANEFIQIRLQLMKAIEVEHYSSQAKLSNQLIKEEFSKINTIGSLLKEINKVFTINGEININCSLVLVKLDQQINELIKSIYEACEVYQRNNSEKLMENLVYQRNDRYCLLIKNTYRNSGGIVLAESSSKLAAYYEPNSLIALNNKLLKLHDDFAVEVERILKELTKDVVINSETLANNQEGFIVLDEYYTKARFMLEHKAVNASLSEELIIDLKGARHFEIPKEKVVTNDYQLTLEKPLLLLSGPNTGGKTVSLKTIGLALLASYYGLPVLAYEATIGHFTKIFIDIGDLQSISNSLSSFSAHLKTLVEIIKYSDQQSLIIIDELGNGTDPNEGAAFAQAILDELLAKGCFALITTHFNQLKQYAYEKSQIKVAAMEFDLEKHLPTYKVINDHTGSSYGLLIAREYHIPNRIITRAQEYLARQTTKSEELLNELNNKLAENNRKNQELIQELNTNKELNEKLQLKLDKFEEYKEQIIKEVNDKADEELYKLKTQAKALIDSYSKDRKDHVSIKLLKDIDDLAIKPVVKEVKTNYELLDYVKLLATGQIGQIIEIKGKNLLIDVGGVKIKTTKDKVKLGDYQPTIETTSIKKVISKEKVNLSINVIGKRVDEALIEVSKYLDNCLANNYNNVTIIHGMGTGALKKAIWEYLSKHKYVGSYRLGEIFEGSSGVTVVTFGDKEVKDNKLNP